MEKSADDNGSKAKGCYFFAGGGTGGHIYPAIAIAERIRVIEPESRIIFFCSARVIDSKILKGSGFEFVALPGRGFSARPDRAAAFLGSLVKSYDIAKRKIATVVRQEGVCRAVLVGVGGFASVPAVLAAGRLRVPIGIVNVDIVPGRANKLLGRFAKKIFVQFEDTVRCFGKAADKVEVVGCPLRGGFGEGYGGKVAARLGLDVDKKTLVVTGASSGSLNINRAVAKVLLELGDFAGDWQVVHLTGSDANTRRQQELCGIVGIDYHLVDYCDDMAGLFGCADLIVGRGGAVSVAEFAASGTAVVCIPYPYHKDRHQYLNAAKLVEAGAAVIVDDLVDDAEGTAKSLLDCLKELMADDERRNAMAMAAKEMGDCRAADAIAEAVTGL